MGTDRPSVSHLPFGRTPELWLRQDAGAQFDCPGIFGGSGFFKNAQISPG
jgi:hypothetical protein